MKLPKQTNWKFLAFCASNIIVGEYNSRNSLVLGFIENRSVVSGEWKAERKVRIFFTSRFGGYSQGRYSELNLSFKTGDKIEVVNRNRQKIFRQTQLSVKKLFSPEQVHGNKVVFLNRDFIKSAQKSVVPDSDGLITPEAGIPLMALFADCIPVVLFDKHAKVAGVVHAGWRGTHQNIVRNAVNLMVSEAGVKAEDLMAIIGPGIGGCCYEVSGDLVNEFKRHPQAIKTKQNKTLLDLKVANTKQLIDSGLSKSDIHDLDICTSCDSSFFSYRRDKGITGRHAAIVCIEND